VGLQSRNQISGSGAGRSEFTGAWQTALFRSMSRSNRQWATSPPAQLNGVFVIPFFLLPSNPCWVYRQSLRWPCYHGGNPHGHLSDCLSELATPSHSKKNRQPQNSKIMATAADMPSPFNFPPILRHPLYITNVLYNG
jgi:hypothetical protein